MGRVTSKAAAATRIARAAAPYLGVGAIASVAAILLLQLWQATLYVPFTYGGDGFFNGMVIKSIAENGWYLDNPRVGWPTGLQMHDFPLADTTHLVIIRFLSLFTHEWGSLMNLYFLLGFPLIAISAAVVFRHFGAGWRATIVGSVLYAFLPSRLLKGEAHIQLDVFYQVPLGVLAMLWVCSERPPLLRGPSTGRPQLDLASGRSVAALLICVLMGTTGVYYAFFTALLLVAGGLCASIERRSINNLLAGVVLAGTIGATLVACVSPTLLYHRRFGPNPQVGTRDAGQAESLGLKLTELLLPIDGHRIPAWRALKERYHASAPLVNENRATSLGAIGGVGFLVLLGVLLAGGRRRRDPDADARAAAAPAVPPIAAGGVDPALLRPLAMLALLAFLLGTIGGFGSLVALFITPSIRTYSRINVIVGFLALFAVVVLLDRLERRYREVVPFLLPVILGLGLLDQVRMPHAGDYAAIKAAYDSNETYFRQLEASVPAGAPIFQVPYQSFPEGAAVYHMETYGPLIAYMHSHSARWSYPTIVGRPGDVWARTLAAREPAQMVNLLADGGAAGILLDRLGYAPDDTRTETTLRSSLGEPFNSPDGRLAFFHLSPYDRSVHADDSAEVRERKRDRALKPVVFTWDHGCYPVEQGPTGPFHWCSSTGELEVENVAGGVREVSVRMTMFPAHTPASIAIDGDLVNLPATDLPAAGIPFARVLKVAPGRHLIRFHCNGKPAIAPGDPRTMLWHANDIDFAQSLQVTSP